MTNKEFVLSRYPNVTVHKDTDHYGDRIWVFPNTVINNLPMMSWKNEEDLWEQTAKHIKTKDRRKKLIESALSKLTTAEKEAIQFGIKLNE